MTFSLMLFGTPGRPRFLTEDRMCTIGASVTANTVGGGLGVWRGLTILAGRRSGTSTLTGTSGLGLIAREAGLER